MQTCTAFVADVEKAVKEKCVTIEALCEKWGTPEVKPRHKVATLADLNGNDISSIQQQQQQVERKAKPTGDDDDDSLGTEESLDRNLGGEPNVDGKGGGDGRYS